MSKPIITYFKGFDGRGGLARRVLEVGKVPYEQGEIEFGAWTGGEKMNASKAHGQLFQTLPTCEHKDLSQNGKVGQSPAVHFYAASLGLNKHLTLAQLAVEVQFLAWHKDANVIQLVPDITEKLKGGDAKEAANTERPKMEALLATAERILPASGFVQGGPAPTLADICLVDMVGNKALGESSAMTRFLFSDAELASKFPKVTAVLKGVEAYVAAGKDLSVEMAKYCEKAAEREKAAAGAKPTMTYFAGIDGRNGLATRVMNFAQVPFTQKDMTFPEWGGGAKTDASCTPGALFQTLPVMEHPALPQGGKIGQSTGVHFMAGALGVNKNLSQAQLAVEVQYLELHKDMVDALGTPDVKEALAGGDPVALAKEQTPILEGYMQSAERIIPESGFIQGLAAPTLADFTLLDIFELTVTKDTPALTRHFFSEDELAKTYPKVSALVKRVQAARN